MEEKTIHVNPVGKIKKDIYIIKNDINTKVYIGQSINSENRFKSHCKKGNKDNSLIDSAIQKYGKEHFHYEILEKQIENYNEREEYWIKYYRSLTPNGYNILEGGNEPPTYYGDESSSTKISDKDVILLKKDLKETKISLSKLADKYSISKKQVLRINQGLSRKKDGEKYPIREVPNINGKLTEDDIDSIIFLLRYSYESKTSIANKYGVNPNAIRDINSGKTHHRDYERYPIRIWSCNKEKSPVTYDQVTEIINLLKNSELSINKIAKEYNVRTDFIKNINTGKTKRYYRENIKYPIRPF